MSTPQERIEADLKAALKAREKERLSTLRMLLTEIKNERIKRGSELDDGQFLALVQRAVKQRKESAEQFHKGGREELAAKEEAEIEVLSGYLPRQASEEEIRRAIEELAAAEGLSGPKDIGRVMKPIMGRFGASAEGATVNRIAREVLSGG